MRHNMLSSETQKTRKKRTLIIVEPYFSRGATAMRRIVYQCRGWARSNRWFENSLAALSRTTPLFLSLPPSISNVHRIVLRLLPLFVRFANASAKSYRSQVDAGRTARLANSRWLRDLPDKSCYYPAIIHGLMSKLLHATERPKIMSNESQRVWYVRYAMNFAPGPKRNSSYPADLIRRSIEHHEVEYWHADRHSNFHRLFQSLIEV